MGLCCSKPVIANPTETPSAVVRPEPIAMEQNPMIPPGRDQPGVPPGQSVGPTADVQDEITIVHVVTPVNVEDAIEVVVTDPTEILPAVEETILVELCRDSTKATCVIERYKEAIGVIEKHPREPTAI